MAATSFFGGAFFGGEFFNTPAPVVNTKDTHDGFDEEIYERVKEEQAERDRAFVSKRERLRRMLSLAWEPEPGPIAAEVKELAAPYVEQLESGALRVDYAALQRKQTINALLAFQDELRAEFAARMAAYEADEDDVLTLTMAL